MDYTRRELMVIAAARDILLESFNVIENSETERCEHQASVVQARISTGTNEFTDKRIKPNEFNGYVSIASLVGSFHVTGYNPTF